MVLLLCYFLAPRVAKEGLVLSEEDLESVTVLNLVVIEPVDTVVMRPDSTVS